MAAQYDRSVSANRGARRSSTATAADEREGGTGCSDGDEGGAADVRRAPMRFPLIFLSGTYFGSTQQLLRMSNESRKLGALIHRPADLKMKQRVP